jgi:hypothetical protein
MEHSERQEPSGHDVGGAPSADETLRQLGDRLERASEAAERLLAQAAGETLARMAGAARGAQEPGDGSEQRSAAGDDREPAAGDEREPAAGDDREPGDEREPAAGDDREPGDERKPAAGDDREPAAAGRERPPGPDSDPSRRPPPSGWQTPGADAGAADERDDVELFGTIIQSLRELIPPELQRRLAAALRELLLALRALIDWYLERIDRRRAEPVEVQDIPIL